MTTHFIQGLKKTQFHSNQGFQQLVPQCNHHLFKQLTKTINNYFPNRSCHPFPSPPSNSPPFSTLLPPRHIFFHLHPFSSHLYPLILTKFTKKIFRSTKKIYNLSKSTKKPPTKVSTTLELDSHSL